MVLRALPLSGPCASPQGNTGRLCKPARKPGTGGVRLALNWLHSIHQSRRQEQIPSTLAISGGTCGFPVMVIVATPTESPQ